MAGLEGFEVLPYPIAMLGKPLKTATHNSQRDTHRDDVLTVKIATQTVASIKPLEDLNSKNRGLLFRCPPSFCSGSCDMMVMYGQTQCVDFLLEKMRLTLQA